MTDQEKREKVIQWLKAVRVFVEDYKAASIDNEIVQNAVSGAIDLLKAQEPRVMTLEEVRRLDNEDVVWLEDKDKPNTIAGIFHKMDRLLSDVSFITSNGIIFPDDKDDYCKRWRCWTSRPTDEQRKAVKWDG